MSEKARKMAKLEWDDSFSVGVKKFDSQHMVLIAYIKQLYDAVEKNEERQAVAKILDGLVSYTMTHFLDEEVEMLKLGYPKFDIHKESHDKFIVAVRDLHIRFRAEKTSVRKITIEMIAVLTDWLTDHILKVDKEYSSFFNSKGVY